MVSKNELYKRYAIIGAVSAVALLLLFATPREEAGIGEWVLVMVSTKGAALVLMALIAAIWRGWADDGEMPDPDEDCETYEDYFDK